MTNQNPRRRRFNVAPRSPRLYLVQNGAVLEDSVEEPAALEFPTEDEEGFPPPADEVWRQRSRVITSYEGLLAAVRSVLVGIEEHVTRPRHAHTNDFAQRSLTFSSFGPEGGFLIEVVNTVPATARVEVTQETPAGPVKLTLDVTDQVSRFYTQKGRLAGHVFQTVDDAMEYVASVAAEVMD